MPTASQKPLFEDWSPRMSLVECENGAWSVPRLVPTAALPVHPAAMGIQFGQSVFEGCKAFRDAAGTAYTFRLPDHHERLVRSCERLCMPAPPGDVFLEAIEQLVRSSTSWTEPFSSDALYIRPVLYGEDHHVMPVPSARSTFVVLTAPLRLFPGSPLSLFAERKYSRAAHGGLGFAKTAANYAHQYLPTRRARDAGCDAVLWLDAERHASVEEASTMNIFLVLGDRLVTPELRDTILAGITRSSVIDLAREKLHLSIEERPFTVDDVAEGVRSGAVTEIFTASTALGVRPVARILDGDRNIVLPDERPSTIRLREELLGIQQGRSPDPRGWRKAIPIE